jgi:hypothetical protein
MALSLQPATVLTGLATLAAGFAFRWCLHRFAPPARQGQTQNREPR